MPRRSSLARSLAFAALLLATGCASLLLPSDGDRARSWKPFVAEHVGDDSLGDYIAKRCALVIRSIVSIKPVSGGFVIEESGVGTAIAIAPDGYLLTAAHCVTDPHPHVIYTTFEGQRIAPARVVWSGDPDDERRDFAIIKVDR